MITLIQAVILLIALPTLAAAAFDSANIQGKDKLDFQSARQNTNAPNFVRLVIMRLIYGIASTMGFEDRLEETFNGAFIPPNADNVLGLGDFGGDGDGDGFLDNIFEGDYL